MECTHAVRSVSSNRLAVLPLPAQTSEHTCCVAGPICLLPRSQGDDDLVEVDSGHTFEARLDSHGNPQRAPIVGADEPWEVQDTFQDHVGLRTLRWRPTVLDRAENLNVASALGLLTLVDAQ